MEYSVTELNRINRRSGRGRYDKEFVYAVLDEALTCNVGYVRDDQPVVVPMTHARINDTVYLHGAKTNSLLKKAEQAASLCISVTLVDGVVFARSAFGHSMNYRSATLFGKARLVNGDDEKFEALRAVVEHIAPSRWGDIRKPNKRELETTSVVAVEIESASGKTRLGPPVDEEKDYERPIWAGVLPLRQQALTPIDDSCRFDSVVTPDYVTHYERN